MTNTFSSMEYPHWLIVAGAILLMLGLGGLALSHDLPANIGPNNL
jgi:hypothetical protein